MKEKTFNLFTFGSLEQILELAVISYEVEGDDAAKSSFLQKQAEFDFATARRFKLLQPISRGEFGAHERLGRVLEPFEELFVRIDAPAAPLYALTHIVDGKPKIDFVTVSGPVTRNSLGDAANSAGFYVPDYLDIYLKDGHLDILQLLNDDSWAAVRLLFQAKHYVSALKLALSNVDSISYIEYGDQVGTFQKWLTSYADLSNLEVTADELWELRNSLLHMTNLKSRRVKSGAVGQISFFVGDRAHRTRVDPSGQKYFNFLLFIDTMGAAFGMWADSYNRAPEKFVQFVSRYDHHVSDSRFATSPSPKLPDV